MQSSADISIFTKEYFERKLHYYYFFLTMNLLRMDFLLTIEALVREKNYS